jgi:tetratricopeptide (TPR) repeat protein
MLLATTHRSLRTAFSSRPYSSLFIQDSFAKNALHVLDVGRRFLKFSAIGLFLLGTTAATAYEAIHQYVEHVELSPGVDPDVQKWEWQNSDCCNWTSDPRRGGTDPFIGFRARHIVRAAWMASNWGVGYSTAVVDSGTKHNEGLAGPGGIKVIDAGLQRMEDFLRSAIRIAEEKRTSGNLNPRTFRDLLLCHASVLERLGESFCTDSKAEYERAWSLFPSHGSDDAHVAWKLGNLNLRLGQTDDALIWWSRAILLSCGRGDGSETQIPVLPDVPPSSPQAQRTLTSTLVSLSAFYATSGQFKKAQEVEEAALNLIRSIAPLDPSATPAQALHALYLLHRSSLLSIHLAEVLHARKQPPIVSLQWLSAAAESSERVANALARLPIGNPPVLQANDKPLLDMFKSSRPMHKTATALFRDATRSAAEAWNLMGALHEAQGSTSEKALECYQRAVEWAGPQPDAKKAPDGILEGDWNLIWSNYNRLQQRAKQNKST